MQIDLKRAFIINQDLHRYPRGASELSLDGRRQVGHCLEVWPSVAGRYLHGDGHLHTDGIPDGVSNATSGHNLDRVARRISEPKAPGRLRRRHPRYGNQASELTTEPLPDA